MAIAGTAIFFDGMTSARRVVVVELASDGVVVRDGVVYWTTMGVPTRDPALKGEASLDYSVRNGGLHAVRLDGTDAHDVIPVGSLTTGKQLTVDAAGTLYWGDREGCRVTPLEILYEDNHCLAVAKPAGVPSTHFDGRTETVDRAAKAYLKDKKEPPKWIQTESKLYTQADDPQKVYEAKKDLGY